LLQAFRTEHELRVVCVHYNDAAEQALQALSPLTLELSPINLEDALSVTWVNQAKNRSSWQKRRTNP